MNLKPINSAAIHKWRELSYASAQRRAGGGHRQHDVQLVAHYGHEVRVQRGRAAVRLQRLVALAVDLRMLYYSVLNI